MSIMVLGGGGFFAVADRNYRLKHTDTTVSIVQDEQARDFERLTPRQLQMFDRASESAVYVSDDPFEFPDRVRRNDTYYDFEYTSAYDWTDPKTAVPAFTFLGGFLGVVALVGRSVR